MAKKTKLELTWTGKEERPRLEPHILLEDPELSYRAPHRVSPDDQFDNLLIRGDNLLALKALEQDYAGKVKCIYIDPPYNTGNAFEHYDDSVEHSIWLSLMRDRLEALRALLRPDGVIVAQIGFGEMAYLKVLMDEVFGRGKCIGQVAVRMSHSGGMKRAAKDRRLIKNTEYLLFYFRDENPTVTPVYERCNEYPVNYYHYISRFPEDDRPGQYVPLAPVVGKQFAPSLARLRLKPTNAAIRTLFQQDPLFHDWVVENRHRIVRSHTEVPTISVDFGSLSGDEFVRMETDTRWYYIGVTRSGSPRQLIPIDEKVQHLSRFDEDVGVTSEARIANLLGDWWDGFWRDMSRVGVEGSVKMKESKKPERLIARILDLVTDPGDLVLDSFLGSGTTAAVAHKMRRRWIGIELGEHAESLARERLLKVVDGADPSGVSVACGWRGGGGFRFYRLAPSQTGHATGCRHTVSVGP